MGIVAVSDDVLAAKISAAALTCVGRWGVAKTTLEDVAREAGCGRATIYRTFRGGKAEVLAAVLAREAVRLRSAVDAGVATADEDDLEGVLVGGVVAAARFLEGHDALQFLLAHEPDVVLPHIAFGRLSQILDVVTSFAVPHLARFVPDPEEAARAAEWVARVVMSYTLNPAPGLDLADEAGARRLVRTYVLPGLDVLPGLTAGVPTH